jgi:hypothetical protein
LREEDELEGLTGGAGLRDALLARLRAKLPPLFGY